MRDRAEIICVGTELLLGNIVNTNAAEISQELAGVGVGLYHHTVVGDNPERLRGALEVAFSRNNLVITTGGLGPTYDDLTKEIIAAYFGRELVLDEQWAERLREMFAIWKRPMTDNNLKQAMLPEGCKVLPNENGTAPGAILEQGNKAIVMLPGPPREMLPMLKTQVLPWLQERSGQQLHSHTVHFFGIGESALEHELGEYMQNMQNPTLAPYAKDGEVMLRLTAAAKNLDEAEMLMKPVLDKLHSEYSQYIYGVDIENLQTAVVQKLTQKGLTVAVAESCTGGLVAKRITEVAGSSQVFGLGVVTYSNEAKQSMLGVSAKTLETYGAVSPQTAAEMAKGVRRVSGADIAVAITGIAGPDGGSTEKPVGLVYIGVDSPSHSDVLEHRLSRAYTSQREYIRWVAASNALNMVLRAIEKL